MKHGIVSEDAGFHRIGTIIVHCPLSIVN